MDAANLAVSFILFLASAGAVTLRDHTDSSVISSFVSINGLVCVDGPARVVEGALALKKAGLKGELYTGVSAQAGVTCKDRAYTVGHGEDDCYYGAQTFFRTLSDVAKFKDAENAAVTFYADTWGLDHKKAATMANCTCHPRSSAMVASGALCSIVHGVGSVVHRDPFNQDKDLLCNEGPFRYVTLVLGIFKSTGQLPMHRYDQVAPVSCSELGYKRLLSPVDHCFPQNRVWYNSDRDVETTEDVEQRLLFKDGFDPFIKLYGLNAGELKLTPGCNCFSNSEVGRQMKQCVDYFSGRIASSPIRDWYDDTLTIDSIVATLEQS